MQVLIIDNYDSFTFNLYQYIGEILAADNQPFNVVVKRNNEISLADIQAMNPDRIIISPGPGSPDDPAYFGVCGDVITELGKTIPLLGVCLGMQGMVKWCEPMCPCMARRHRFATMVKACIKVYHSSLTSCVIIH